MILLGAFPFVHFIVTNGEKPLLKISKRWSLYSNDCGGLIATVANSIPMFSKFSTFTDKGKLINMAFAVSGAFVFGDLLGFTAGVNPDMIFPMVIGKLISAICAAFLAGLMYKKISSQLRSE